MHVGHHAGRRLVVRVTRRRRPPASATSSGCVPGWRRMHERVVEERRGGGDGGELRGELTEDEVLGALLDDAERGGVPEHGAARRCRAAPRSRRGARTGRRGRRGRRPHDRAHARRRWLVPRYVAPSVGERAGGLGAHLRRPGAEAAVAGEQLGRDVHGHGVRLPVPAFCGSSRVVLPPSSASSWISLR